MSATAQIQQPILISLLYRKAQGEFAPENVIHLDRDTLIRLVREWEGGDARKHLRPREIVAKARAGELRLQECRIELEE
jgi:hypothetical protein